MHEAHGTMYDSPIQSQRVATQRTQQQPVSAIAPYQPTPRPQYSCEVYVCYEEIDEPMIFDALDVGPRGFFMKSELLMETGDEIAVQLPAPRGDSFITARGRVIGVVEHNEHGPAGMSVEFVGLGRKDWLLLAA